jgi:hypothetical protein
MNSHVQNCCDAMEGGTYFCFPHRLNLPSPVSTYHWFGVHQQMGWGLLSLYLPLWEQNVCISLRRTMVGGATKFDAWLHSKFLFQRLQRAERTAAYGNSSARWGDRKWKQLPGSKIKIKSKHILHRTFCRRIVFLNWSGWKERYNLLNLKLFKIFLHFGRGDKHCMWYPRYICSLCLGYVLLWKTLLCNYEKGFSPFFTWFYPLSLPSLYHSMYST